MREPRLSVTRRAKPRFLFGAGRMGRPGRAGSWQLTTKKAVDVNGSFTTIPIAGQWRPGRSGKSGTDTDPWSGDTLTEIPLASAEDVDEAFWAAAAAQRDWAAAPPSDRSAVMRTAARLMEERKDEITGWLVCETGGTVAKAELEWEPGPRRDAGGSSDAASRHRLDHAVRHPRQGKPGLPSARRRSREHGIRWREGVRGSGGSAASGRSANSPPNTGSASSASGARSRPRAAPARPAPRSRASPRTVQGWGLRR